MAITLLDGTSATSDATIVPSGGGTATSIKCLFGYFGFNLVKEMYEATTFCSSGWRSRRPGMKQLTGTAAGYQSTGSIYSDPMALFSANVPLQTVLTIDTGSTLSFKAWFQDGGGMRAAGMSDRTLAFESDGVVTSVWVTT